MLTQKRLNALLLSIPFKDETDEEFAARAEKRKLLFKHLNKKLPKRVRFAWQRRDNKIKNEAQAALEEIPSLLEFVDQLYPSPSIFFERRLEKYAK